MKQETKAQWLQALRSGVFEQGRRSLCDEEKYCCLGVLCEITPGIHKRQRTSEEYEYAFRTDDYFCGYLPPCLANEVELSELDQHLLAELNDDEGASFEDIANYIEEKL